MFSDLLLDWYDQHGRKDLPWQQNPSPYHVWLSEIMLQQTQVTTVIPYYQRFTERYPNVTALAQAKTDDVLALWTGLGYYARARNLHKTANIIVDSYYGEMPTTLDELIALPGIGRSTAGAIMSLAHKKRYSILDGNVKRVLARYFAVEGWPGIKTVENTLWNHAESLLPQQRVANYIQAQMDLGATLCTRSKPDCNRCPLKQNCQAYKQGNPTDYPTSKPKKVAPIRKTNWIIAQNDSNEILLEKRPPSGIWGGLWTFPEFDDEKELTVYCKSQYDLSVLSSTQKPALRHVFSHFKLDITPHIITCKTDLSQINETKNTQWYRISDALVLGLPAPVKSLLHSLQ
jgi:A/G-specific adenine glycosylase